MLFVFFFHSQTDARCIIIIIFSRQATHHNIAETATSPSPTKETMPKNNLITPPHHNYPSDPDEPRLLIPPQEHRGPNMVPLIWDPTRPSAPGCAVNASVAPTQARVNLDVKSSQCMGRPSSTEEYATYEMARLRAIYQSAHLHHFHLSNGPKFMLQEGYYSTLAAFQLMMYLNYPCFPSPIPSHQPMSCSFEFDESRPVGTIASPPGSEYEFEPDVPYSSGVFKHATGDF
jgi:hypothetical protein